ncbi:hypothetical protein E4U21_007125 [Claviceps maximensis]|nr:hypothetical protein E4U21_007125 [Claviceps maximensis]
MRVVVLYILAISTIVHYRRRQSLIHYQARPWKQSRRDQGLESARGSDGDGGFVVDLPVGTRPWSNIEIVSQGEQPPVEHQPAGGQSLANPKEEQPPARQTAMASGSEGLETHTVLVTEPATSHARTEDSATVTITQLASTVTQTVTASCMANNPRPVNDARPANPSGGKPEISARPEPQVVDAQIILVDASSSASQESRAGHVDQHRNYKTASDLAVIIVGEDHGNGLDPKVTCHQVAVKKCVFGTIRGELHATCDDVSTIPIIEGIIPTFDSPPTQTQVEMLPMASAKGSGSGSGNGIGVSIIPIAESALPTTTRLAFDPASAPSIVVTQSAPLPSSSLVQDGPPVESAPSLAAEPVSQVDPAISLSGSSSSSSESPTTWQTATKTAVTAGPTKSRPTLVNSYSSSVTSSSLRPATPSSSTPTSAVTAFPRPHLVESLALGRLGPSPTAIKDSALVPGLSGIIAGSGAVAPAQPAINLSGLRLSSYQNLGSLYDEDQPA